MNQFIVILANATAQQNQAKQMSTFTTVLWVVVFFAFMYFMLLRPQKKKEKEAEQLRASVDIGDEIVTIGGVVGTVVSMKDEFIVIETSGDRNKLRINRWAIHSNNTALERKEKEMADSKKQK